MSYTFLDAYSSVQSADSSVIAGTTLRQAIDIASVLTAIPVSFSGSPSISGSVTITGTPSISGTVIASIAGWPGGGVMGSVATLQGTNPWLVRAGGSIIAVTSGSVATVQTGTVIASMYTGIVGSSVQSAISSVIGIGASIIGQLPAGTAPLGSVAVLQGTNPWVVNGSVSGTIGASVLGNVNTTITSIATVGQVMGSVAALQGTLPWAIAGSVAAVQSGAWSASVMTNIITSIATAGQVMGSVAALQGTNPWIVNFANSSILAVPVGSVITVPTGSVITVVQGSVAAAQTGTQITSIVSSIPSSVLVGAYAQRNDATASFLGGNLTWNPIATDSAGRLVIKPFTSDDGTTIRFASSTVSTSTMLVQASAIGKRNYVTDFWFANTGATTTLATIKDGSTSVLGYAIVPTGGGSNSQGIHVPIRSAPSQDLTLSVSPATSVLYVTMNGYQSP